MVKKSKLILRKILINIFILIMVCISAFFVIYLDLNNEIKKSLETNKNEKFSSVEVNYSKILFDKKNYTYIKENLDTLEISNKRGRYDITLDSKNISRYLSLNIRVQNSTVNCGGIKGLEGIIVNTTYLNSIEKIKTIRVNLKEYYSDKKSFDLYYISNKNELIYVSKLIPDEQRKVVFTPVNKGKYLIIYVPNTSLSIQDKEVTINKGSSYEIKSIILPENATNKELLYEWEPKNVIDISSSGVITTKNSGQAQVVIKSPDKGIKINLKVNIKSIVETIELSTNSVQLKPKKSIKITAKALPENAENKELVMESTNTNIASIDEEGNITGKSIGKCEIKISTKVAPIVTTTISVKVSNNSVSTNSASSVTYIKGILIVNKKYSLPADYNPGVNSVAEQSFNKMKDDASKAGFNLRIISGFRSYQLQQSLYNNYVSQYGEETANTFSAKAGQSEHQTGLAFDISSLEQSYGDTPEGKWLALNCYKYGYIIRYPISKQSITGYIYEPWHIRYVGVDVATEIYNRNICLEEYLGI